VRDVRSVERVEQRRNAVGRHGENGDVAQPQRSGPAAGRIAHLDAARDEVPDVGGDRTCLEGAVLVDLVLPAVGEVDGQDVYAVRSAGGGSGTSVDDITRASGSSSRIAILRRQERRIVHTPGVDVEG